MKLKRVRNGNETTKLERVRNGNKTKILEIAIKTRKNWKWQLNKWKLAMILKKEISGNDTLTSKKWQWN